MVGAEALLPYVQRAAIEGARLVEAPFGLRGEGQRVETAGGLDAVRAEHAHADGEGLLRQRSRFGEPPGLRVQAGQAHEEARRSGMLGTEGPVGGRNRARV